MTAEVLYSLGIALIVAGMAILMIAVLSLLFSSVKKGGKTRGGGVVLIGPFPIVFGSDKKSVKTLLVLSIILTILLITLIVLVYFLYR